VYAIETRKTQVCDVYCVHWERRCVVWWLEWQSPCMAERFC